MSNVRHSSENPKWGTSPEVIEIADAVLGAARMACPNLIAGVEFNASIYVDPFSEPEFNAHVGAWKILTGAKGDDGFRDRWINDDESPRADQVLAGLARATDPLAYAYTAIVNPPGDDSGDNVKKAWRILDLYHQLGWIDSAVWVAFSLNHLQTLQGVSKRSLLCADFVRCAPAKRLPFTRHSSTKGDDAPSHPMCFTLLPSHNPRIAAEQMRLFESMASKLGEVF